MNRTPPLTVLAGAIAAMAATPASADPPWSAPATISGAGFSQPSFVSFSAPGTGIVVDAGFRRAHRRAAIRGGVVGPASSLTLPFRPAAVRAYGPDRFAAAGEAVVRRGRQTQVMLALGGIDSRVSVRRVSRRGTRVRFNGMDANGDGAIAVAYRDGSALRLVHRPAGRRFRRAVTIARPGATYGGTVAVNARGDVLVAWNGSSRRRGEETAVFARIVRPSGRRTRARRIGPSWWNSNVHAALSADGRALVAWAPADGGGDVVAAHGSSSGRFNPAQVLADVRSGARAPAVDAAFTTNGEGVVVWSSPDPFFLGASQTFESTVAAAVTSGTGFGPPQVLASPGRSAELATGPRGEALVTWVGAGSGPGDVLASVRPAAGVFGPAERVAGAQATRPLAALDPGNAIRYVFAQATYFLRAP